MPTHNSDDLFALKKISMQAVIISQNHEIGIPFLIYLKAPHADERFLDDYKHYTKSNINVCYAAPRVKGKSRNWYETQLSVDKKVRMQDGYPDRGVPFYAITDDGYGFLAHTTSENNKQFAAVGDELTLGRWIKGRLADAGLVSPVEDISKDKDRRGMITQEMLSEYGCNAIAFQKTDLKILYPEDPVKLYEVWTLKLTQVEK